MDQQSIPYFAHEGMMVRQERSIKRLWIALIVAILIAFATNAMWLYAWMQYDCVTETVTNDEVTVDGECGNANYIGGDGDITNGESTSEADNGDEAIEDTKEW